MLEPPPEPERVVPPGLVARLLPLVMLLASIGFIVVLGADNPTSWLFGGMFMVLADLAARTVLAPQELPVGAVTALIGAPFFAYIYFHKKKV